MLNKSKITRQKGSKSFKLSLSNEESYTKIYIVGIHKNKAYKLTINL